MTSFSHALGILKFIASLNVQWNGLKSASSTVHLPALHGWSIVQVLSWCPQVRLIISTEEAEILVIVSMLTLCELQEVGPVFAHDMIAFLISIRVKSS
jgi:hypothetical protein